MRTEGHFADSSTPLPASDPIVPTQLLLAIDQIKAYDNNPRKQCNPLFNEIKESIRAQGGLNNPLTVTRRPSDEHYMVESGGNTRLQVLNELFQETSDDRYQSIHCLFRPWVSESHVLTAHLIENDTRGSLCFIDRALGVRSLRTLLETEQKQELSQRQLVDALNERGYGLNQGLISRMDYTVDVLEPLIPMALRAGVGIDQIRRIRRLDGACRKLWEDQKGCEPDTFSPEFNAALKTHDGQTFDLDAVQNTLEERLADGLQWSLKDVRLVLDAALSSDARKKSGPLPVNPVFPAPPPTTVVPIVPRAGNKTPDAIPDDQTGFLAPHATHAPV